MKEALGQALIVDDQAAYRMQLRLILAEEGYTVVGEAGDGFRAVQLAQQLQPDYVFLDVEMPGTGGLEVLADIRRLAPKSRVIMVTGHAEREIVEGAIEAGAAGYVLKPFNKGTVLDSIADAAKRALSPADGDDFAKTAEDEKLPLRILVLEDDDALTRLYRAQITTWPIRCTVELNTDGYDGLLTFRKSPPHLLVCDLGMPRVNGFQIVRSLTSVPGFSRTRIVVVSGMSPDEIERQGGLPESVELLAKPIDFERLREIAFEIDAGRRKGF